MKLTKTVNGVTFERRHNMGDPSRYVWEGGAAGGTVFISRSGKFGHSREWHDTFETAAERSMLACRERYLQAKKLVDAYEKQVDAYK